MRRRALGAITIAVVGSFAFGCLSAHEPREVSSGVYELKVRVERDACLPMRTGGELGPVGVVSEHGVLNLAVPAGIDARLLRVSLARDEGYHAEVITDIPGCIGAHVRRAWTVVDIARDRLEVLFEQTWRGLDGCEVPRDQMPLSPMADCEASQVLEYVLREACPPTCDVLLGSAGTTCSC
jgi:hypothetical protein